MGYDHHDSLQICHAAQLVDHCSRSWLKSGPSAGLQLYPLRISREIYGCGDPAKEHGDSEDHGVGQPAVRSSDTQERDTEAIMAAAVLNIHDDRR